MRLLWAALLIACASAFTAEAQNLIQNGGFDQGLDGWRVGEVGGGVVSHSSEDAEDSASSGSAELRLPGGPLPQIAAVSQCVVLDDDPSAAFTESLRLDQWRADVCSHTTFFADVSWFDSTDCSGQGPIRADLLVELEPGTMPKDLVKRVDAIINQPPAGAHSAAFAFFADLRAPEGSCIVRVDNVVVGTEENEPPQPAPDLAVSVNLEDPVPLRSGVGGFRTTFIVTITNVGDATSSKELEIRLGMLPGHSAGRFESFEVPDECKSERGILICPLSDLAMDPGETVDIPFTVSVRDFDPSDPFPLAVRISSPGDQNHFNDVATAHYDSLLDSRGRVIQLTQRPPKNVSGRNR